MIKKTLFLAALLTLAGCSTVPTVPEQVLVPVASSCPVAVLPDEPVLAIRNIHENSTPGEVAKAYVISIEQLKSYAQQLETILKAYGSNENEQR